MNKPLPKISCNKCNMTQDYRGQADCIHCNQRLNNWSVASQLSLQKKRTEYDYQYDWLVKKEKK